MKTMTDEQRAALMQWLRGEAMEQARALREAGWEEDERGLWHLPEMRPGSRLHLLDAYDAMARGDR